MEINQFRVHASMAWWSSTDDFYTGMRAIALNLPGYGASSKTIGGWQGKAGLPCGASPRPWTCRLR